jgi:hypothetical protein
LQEERIVKYLQLISIVMVVAGVVVTIGAPVLDLSKAITLTGLMLVVTGVVNGVVVYLWRKVAGL